jgi:hypothetical protein
MSYYLYNFEEDFDYDKLIIGDKIKLENNSYRYYIYYLDKTPKDFYIKLPSIKLIYSYKNNKFNQVKIPLYPIYDKIEKLISFFKKLKKKIKEFVPTEKKYSDSVEKKENLKLLKINISNEFKFNSNNEKLDIKELKTTSEIYGILNIPYIWENENSYGLSLNATKMFYLPKIDDDNVNFIDIFETKKSIIKQEIKNIDNPIITKVPLCISPNLLLEMKSKLNKIN